MARGHSPGRHPPGTSEPRSASSLGTGRRDSAARLSPEITQKPLPDIEWRLAWLAGEMLAEIAQEMELPKPLQTLECVESWLVALLDQDSSPPAERAKAGSVLDSPAQWRPASRGLCSQFAVVPGAGRRFLAGNKRKHGRILQARSGCHATRSQTLNTKHLSRRQETPPPAHWQGEHPPAGLNNHPVVQVTWKQANQYCAWYTARLFSEPFLLWRSNQAEKLARAPDDVSRDWVVRLPTSQEWEKAARGGLQIPASDGERTDNPLPRRAYPWSDGWQFSEHGDQGRRNQMQRLGKPHRRHHACGHVPGRRQPIWRDGHGRQCLGMVPGLGRRGQPLQGPAGRRISLYARTRPLRRVRSGTSRTGLAASWIPSRVGSAKTIGEA